MARVLVAGKIHKDGMDVLTGAGFAIDQVPKLDTDMAPEVLAKADALLLRYGALSQANVEAMPALRIVSRHGVGCDGLPLDLLSTRGVPVTVVGPVNAVSVAEQTIALLLAVLKRIPAYDAAVRGGDWGLRDSLGARELSGRRMLVMGFGRIGREVARRAKAFDVDVAVYDPFVTAADIAAAGYDAVADWQAALPDIDVLSVHVPLAPETRNLIGRAELARMKPTAILLNAGRGGLIDEAALFAELSGRMAAGGAGIDCFETEPPALDNPLFGLQNVVLSPHSAALSAEAAQRMAVVAAQNIVAALQGKVDRRLVFNLAALEAAGHEL
ncbi:hydroxyacid dehydrogenase [Phaeovulum sp.]|uniref:hydroxyacid dehydrogenase n=1 Tax=Phaeovulum sp. TaxID=2934796 RepID=UPI0035632409